MPLKNSPARLKTLIYFFSAERAAALYPGVGVKEWGQSTHFAGVSQIVEMFLGKRKRILTRMVVPFCKQSSVSIACILFSSSSSPLPQRFLALSISL